MPFLPLLCCIAALFIGGGVGQGPEGSGGVGAPSIFDEVDADSQTGVNMTTEDLFEWIVELGHPEANQTDEEVKFAVPDPHVEDSQVIASAWTQNNTLTFEGCFEGGRPLMQLWGIAIGYNNRHRFAFVKVSLNSVICVQLDQALTWYRKANAQITRASLDTFSQALAALVDRLTADEA
eukprot:EG_transcript_28046